MQLDPSRRHGDQDDCLRIACPGTISIDPLSGDLFTDDTCGGFANASVWRVSDPGGVSPSTSVYATLPSSPNATLAFAPGGTIYAWVFSSDVPKVAQISGTNVAPTTVSVLSGIQLNNFGLLAGGSGDGTFLIATPFAPPPIYRRHQQYRPDDQSADARDLAHDKVGRQLPDLRPRRMHLRFARPHGFQDHRHCRRLHLCCRARVPDTGAVADVGVAESGARNVANLRCHAPLRESARRRAGGVQCLRCKPADSARDHQRQWPGVVQLTPPAIRASIP